MSDFLQIAFEAGILRVAINRPAQRNALSQAVLGALRACFEAHAGHPDLVAAILTGAGERCFAAGGDLKEFDTLRDREGTVAMGRHSRDALDAIRQFPVPVIALLNGDAIGGGAELAVACDMRILAAHARIAFVQGSMGISPAWGGGVDLVRLVGPARALRLLTRAEFIDGELAFTLGLADAVAPSETSFASFAEDFLAPILERKPQVMRAFKAITRAASRSAEHLAARELEAAQLVETWLHPDHWAAHDRTLARISGRGPDKP
jgi:enoyl-CoA hydratase